MRPPSCSQRRTSLPFPKRKGLFMRCGHEATAKAAVSSISQSRRQFHIPKRTGILICSPGAVNGNTPTPAPVHRFWSRIDGADLWSWWKSAAVKRRGPWQEVGQEVQTGTLNSRHCTGFLTANYCTTLQPVWTSAIAIPREKPEVLLPCCLRELMRSNGAKDWISDDERCQCRQMKQTAFIWTLHRTQIIVHSTSQHSATWWSDHHAFHQPTQWHIVVRSSCIPPANTVPHGGQIIVRSTSQHSTTW